MYFPLLERFYIKKLKQSLLENQVSIISNDCWGSQAYKYAGVQYNTPFVGLYLMAPCFLSLLENFQAHFSTNQLTFIASSKYPTANQFRQEKQLNYPIGLLNSEIEIHFMHYKSESQALSNWTRRSKRINFSNLAVKFDGGKDGASSLLMQRFLNLPFQKKLLVVGPNNKLGTTSELYVPNWQQDGAKMFRLSLAYFSFINWIKSGKQLNTFWNRMWNRTVLMNSSKLL